MSQQVITLPSAAQTARPKPARKTATPASERPPLRPELEAFLDQAAKARTPLGAKLVRGSHAVRFVTEGRVTSISVEPVDIETPGHSRITEIIRVRTTLSNPGLKGLKDQQLSRFNVYAALGAAVRDPVTRMPVIESRITHYARGDAFLPIIADAANAAAVFHLEGLMTGTRLATGQPAVRYEGLPGFAGPSRWQPRDFDAACNALAGMRLPMESTAYGLRAALPWLEAGEGEGETSPPCGLYLSNSDAHPMLGSGLLGMLEVPGEFDGRRLPALVHRLNQREVAGFALPPLLGAWCMRLGRPRRLAYISFWPNLLYRPEIAHNLAIWLATRADIARRWLANGEV